MADYTTITDTQVDPEAPITSELMSALRDNPIAIAEGATGAPLISGALRKVITDQEIGAFIFAVGPSTTSYGGVVAGSSLTYAGALSSITAVSASGIFSFSFNGGSSGSPAGSWVCLGRIQATGSGSGTNVVNTAQSAATLWQRVS